jgi:hypothetical protein
MKKVLSFVAVAALSVAFVACGPSKEELEKIEQAKQDSIAAVESPFGNPKGLFYFTIPDRKSTNLKVANVSVSQ